jgi:hypothetical protein
VGVALVCWHSQQFSVAIVQVYTSREAAGSGTVIIRWSKTNHVERACVNTSGCGAT